MENQKTVLVPFSLLTDWRNWNKSKAQWVAAFIINTLGWTQLNKLHHRCRHEQGAGYISSLLDFLNIQVAIPNEDIQRLPSQGPFITVSNHPYGGLDGLILLHLLLKRQVHPKVLANFLLTAIPNLNPHFIPIDPFQNAKKSLNKKGFLAAIRHIQNGGCISLFPAGEVSRFDFEQQGVRDKEWELPSIKFIKHCQVPVVPIYFEGGNSLLFHILEKIHPTLGTLKLPTEITQKKNKVIGIRIGKPISADKITGLSHEQLRDYLRASTYALNPKDSLAFEMKQAIKSSFSLKPLAVNEKEDSELFHDEVTNMLHMKTWFSAGNLSVIGVHGSEIPQVLKEIGRLRELTYREIGEGTQLGVDTDSFDDQFFHLILWDQQSSSIIGAYRLQHNHWSFKSHYTQGYLETLFKFKKPTHPIIGKCVELGRSFIVSDFQKKPLPLLLLWKGIYRYTQKHPNVQYIIGPVSISSSYKQLSREILVQYLKKEFWRQDLAQYIKPKNKAVKTKPHKHTHVLLEEHGNGIQSVDQLIREVEGNGHGLPVLIRKYLQMNARVIGLNQDPEFSNVTDALMLVDLRKIPATYKKRLTVNK